MTNQYIQDVLNAFRILLVGNREVLGDIEIISLDEVRQWTRTKVEGYLSMSRYTVDALNTPKKMIEFLQEIIEDQSLTQNTYRCICATIFEYGLKTSLDDERSVRLFVFLLRISEQLPLNENHRYNVLLTTNLEKNHIDHDILYRCYSSDLLGYFEDDFENMFYDHGRVRSILADFYNILRIYQECHFRNWRFFHLTNPLVNERIIHIRSINSNNGKVTYKNPVHLFD